MKNLPFIDIETTGLDPAKGVVLEVGIVVTTPDLAEVAAESWVVFYDPERADALRSAVDPKVRLMHDENGLWSALSDDGAGTLEGVEAMAVQFLRRHDAHAVEMWGSTISFDRAWLAVHLPGLHAAFHYRNVDVRSLAIAAEMWGGLADLAEPVAHRSVADCRQAIARARRIRNLMRNGNPAGAL